MSSPEEPDADRSVGFQRTSFAAAVDAENRQLLRVSTYCIGITMLAWTVFDYIVAPEHLFLFLTLRLTTVAIAAVLGLWVPKFIRTPRSLLTLWWWHCLVWNIAIAVMLYYVGGSEIYYQVGSWFVMLATGFVPIWPVAYVVTNVLVQSALLMSALVASGSTPQELIIAGMSYASITSLMPIMIYLRFRARKRLHESEENLKAANAQLRTLDEAKTRFVSNVTHEFRTPLVALSSTIQSALSEQKMDEVTFKKLLSAGADALDDMLDNVNNIMMVARSGQDAMGMRWRSVALGAWVGRALSVFETLAADRDVNLSFHQDTDQDITLYADHEKLKKIFNNLVGNALKFTPAGGRIEVRVALDGEHAALTVADSGQGIPPEELATIFEPFTQASNNRERDAYGSGVGLALVKQLVTLHQGRIDVQSTLGEGSVFTVWLPLGEAHVDVSALDASHIADGSVPPLAELWQQSTTGERRMRRILKRESERNQNGVREPSERSAFIAPNDRHASSGRAALSAQGDLQASDRQAASSAQNVENEPWDRIETPVTHMQEAGSQIGARFDFTPFMENNPAAPTILLVEDNLQIAYVLGHILHPEFNVRFARDGEAGLRVAKHMRPDLVVSDVMMPKMNGYELVRALRQDEALATVPVVMLTSKGSARARLSGFESGADDYLSKPFNNEEVLVRIRGLLTRSRLTAAVAALRDERLQWLERLTGFLRHELKNQLTAADTSLRLAAKAADNPERRQRYMERAKQGLQRMRTLVHTATEATNLEAALSSETMDAVDLSALVRDRCHSFEESHQDVRVETTLNGATTVQGNETRLVQLLDKLLSNAAEHRAPDAPIRVSVEHADAPRSDGTARVMLRIENEGDPLPAEPEALFDPYVSTGKHQDNTGLGLYVVKVITENHGGSVRAYPLPHATGAGFEVALPVAES